MTIKTADFGARAYRYDLPEATTMHEKYHVFGRGCTLRLEPFTWDVQSIGEDCDVLDGYAGCL